MSLGYWFEDASEEEVMSSEGGDAGLDTGATQANAEVQQDQAEIKEAEVELTDAQDAVELADEVNDEIESVVAEGHGYDAAGLAILGITLRHIAGPRMAKKLLANVNMESANTGVSGRREQTRLVHEGFKEVLKRAWEAIKNAFKKAWSKIKTWYIKTFDASKRLKAKAEKIRDRANSTSSTIDEKKFTFSGIKTLHINGKLTNNHSLSKVRELVSDILQAPKSAAIENRLDKVVDAIENAVKYDSTSHTASYSNNNPAQGTNNDHIGKIIAAALDENSSYTRLSQPVTDSKIKEKYGIDSLGYLALMRSEVLPGNKYLARISLDSSTTPAGNGDWATALRKARYFIADVTTGSGKSERVKEVSATEADTLNNSQIAEICDDVVEIADVIFDYKKGWEARDKFNDRVVKELDRVFNEAAKDADDDENGKNQVARELRSFASAITGFVTKDSSFKTALVSYAMNVSSVSLSYCVESFSHHKK